MNLRSIPSLALVVASSALLGCPTAVEPVCGDEVVDEPEACDDGNAWGGDGCTHLCTAEDAAGEQDDNDEHDEAQPLDGGRAWGSLTPGDRDCFATSVADAGAVGASVGAADGGACDFEVLVELVGPDGERVTSALPAADGDCPTIDPDTDTWARYLAEGDYAVCVEPMLDSAVRTYSLQVTTADSCSDLAPLTPDPSQDLEGDGIADVCDEDDDDDGEPDATDNCPEAPNGPEQPFPWSTEDEGFARLWLVLGPFTDGETPADCEPSPDSFAAESDADAAPALGDRVDDVPWFATFSRPGASATVSFTTWFSPSAPREAYAATWVYAPDARDGILALGSDDGHRAWLNGVEVGVNAGCHGANVDQFRYPVSLEDGWNRLLVKVYDGGGGWALVARFYEDDAETPMTDLELSIGGPEPWLDDQGDGDGDGVGDFCDPEP